MNLEENRILYAGLTQVIRRGTAEILEETENGIFLKDTVSEAFMLAVEDIKMGKEWLKKHSKQNYHLFSVFHKEIVEYIKQEYGLSEVLDCYQAMYPFDIPPINRQQLQVNAATETGNEDFKRKSILDFLKNGVKRSK